MADDAGPLEIRPRRPDAASVNHTEIYLPEQVLVVFHDDRPVLISHISSGTGEEWCDEVTISPASTATSAGPSRSNAASAESRTRQAVCSTTTAKSKGSDRAPSAPSSTPSYFNYGIAVHGAYNVPVAARLARLHPYPQRLVAVLLGLPVRGLR